MNEMINKIGARLVIKMGIVNTEKREGNYEENFRECPFYSEFVGMTQMLKTMDIDFDIEYDDSVTYMTAITIMGKRFEV